MEVKNEIVKSLAAGEEVFWLNPKMELFTEERAGQELSMKDIERGLPLSL